MKQLDEYLKRIKYQGDPRIDLETLTAIHRQHLLTIPYENLDVQLKRPLDLDIDRIYQKIVVDNRGGWCYEMNGILDWALQEIGFDVTRVNGGVARSLRGDDAMGNHLVLLVRLENTYIADTGFGDGVIDPILLSAGPIEQRGFNYRLQKLDDGYWRFHNHEHGGAPSFDFTEDPADEQLFADKCAYLQTSDESPFVLALIAQRFVEGGYEVQLGRIARRVTTDGVASELLDNEQQLIDRLKHTFGIDVPQVADIWPDIVARHEEFFSEAE
jgi:N-hydroxyarylamine O-acetyltransferase